MQVPLWKVLPCAVPTCPEKREYGPVCRAHAEGEHKEAKVCSKCHIYSTKTRRHGSCNYCLVCFETVSDCEPKDWCAHTTGRESCERTAHNNPLGFCRKHLAKSERCDLCGVYREKKYGNIKMIGVFGRKACRRCVNRTRKMSALMEYEDLPAEFRTAWVEVKEQQEDRDEKRAASGGKKQRAHVDMDYEDDSEGLDHKHVDIEGDLDGLDHKHVDIEDDTPVCTRTRGGIKRRREGQDGDFDILSTDSAFSGLSAGEFVLEGLSAEASAFRNSPAGEFVFGSLTAGASAFKDLSTGLSGMLERCRSKRIKLDDG